MNTSSSVPPTKKKLNVKIHNTSLFTINPEEAIDCINTDVIRACGLEDHLQIFFDLLDPNFWRTQEEFATGVAGTAGCCGHFGNKVDDCACCHPPPAKEVSDDRFVMKIVCITLDNPTDVVQSVLDLFQVTKGLRGNILPPISVDILRQRIETHYAIVAKPKTIEAWKILRATTNDKTLTLKEFTTANKDAEVQRRFNSQLVNCIRVGGGGAADHLSGVLGTYTRSVQQASPTYRITIQMIGRDARNSINAMHLGKFLLMLSMLRFEK